MLLVLRGSDLLVSKIFNDLISLVDVLTQILLSHGFKLLFSLLEILSTTYLFFDFRLLLFLFDLTLFGLSLFLRIRLLLKQSIEQTKLPVLSSYYMRKVQWLLLRYLLLGCQLAHSQQPFLHR